MPLSAKGLRRMATPLVLSIFLMLPAISEGQYGHRCEVIPKDPYIEFGSNIKIKFKNTCNKTISDSHGKIYWTINNKSIDESLYETNTSFAAVTIYNLSLPKAIVQCHSHLTQQVLGGTIIQTYWKPRNISCVTYISQQDFTCRWEHKIKPTSKITYTVYRKWKNSTDAWKSDHCSSGSMSCTFNKSLPMLSKLHYITVRAESTVWETISDTLELDPWDTVKIDPPKNVRVVPLPAHLRVEWERPGGTGFLYQVIHCQVKYAKHVMDTSMNTVAKTASVTSVEVESCTNHTVSVRCALDKAPWSEWSSQVTVLSSLNVSTVQLDLWRKMDAPDNTGTRTVHLMWKSISPACKAIDGYRLTYMADEKHMPDRHLDTVVDKASITVDQRAYRVTLAAYRGDTTFSEQSIYVPAVGQSHPQVRGAQASAHDGDIQVSWVPPLYHVHGYIIDWTTDGDTYTWLQSQDTHITLTGLQPFKLYNITVTPLYDDKTGLEKVIQICSVQRAPGNISSVDVHVQDKSAQVNWTAVPQSQCSGDVVNYTVFYKTEKQPELNVTVNSWKQGVTLEPLQPDTRYSVHVMARAVTGATNSSVIHFTTSRYGRTFIIMSCVFGGFGVIIVLVTGLFCAIQWKRFKGKIVPNPGLSSLEFWSSQDCHKIQPFNNPSELETFCEMIYPCEVNTITDDIMGSISTEDRDIQDMGKETVCDQTERWSSGFGSRTFCDSQPREESSNLGLAPTLLPLLAQQDGETNLLESTTSEDSSSEPSDLQASESCPVNPYRLQTPGECPVRLGLGGGEATSGTTEESRSLLDTQQHSSIAPLTAYVTLDMFEHRVRESKWT